MKKSRIFLVMACLVLAVVLFSFLSIKENLVYFYTPKEVYEQAADLQEKTIRVGAMVSVDSIQWDREQVQLLFQVTDYQGHDLEVRYKGTPPDLFKEGQGVVIEGQLEPEQAAGGLYGMQAQKLFVKHSEEYRVPEEGQVNDHEMLKSSIFKNE